MEHRRTALLITWPTLGLLVAVAVGAVARAAVDEALRPVGMAHGTDAFGFNLVLIGFQLAEETGLGTLAGALTGAGVALLGWTTTLIWGAHHLFPEGRRVAPVLLTLTAGIAGVLVGGLVLRATGAAGLGLHAALVLAVTVVVASGGVFLVDDRYLAGQPAPAADEPETDDDPLEGWGTRDADTAD